MAKHASSLSYSEISCYAQFLASPTNFLNFCIIFECIDSQRRSKNICIFVKNRKIIKKLILNNCFLIQSLGFSMETNFRTKQNNKKCILLKEMWINQRSHQWYLTDCWLILGSVYSIFGHKQRPFPFPAPPSPCQVCMFRVGLNFNIWQLINSKY